MRPQHNQDDLCCEDDHHHQSGIKQSGQVNRHEGKREKDIKAHIADRFDFRQIEGEMRRLHEIAENHP